MTIYDFEYEVYSQFYCCCRPSLLKFTIKTKTNTATEYTSNQAIPCTVLSRYSQVEVKHFRYNLHSLSWVEKSKRKLSL